MQNAWVVDDGPEHALGIVKVVSDVGERINGGSHFVEEDRSLATAARATLLLSAEGVGVEVAAVVRVVHVPFTSKAIRICFFSVVFALNRLN